MIELSAEELRARLGAIATGPWAQSVRQARQYLRPADPFAPAIGGTRLLALDQIALSQANRRKSGRLTTILRPHFESGVPIRSPKHLETREALDQALILPQLWELAVQTGYLPETAVRKPARHVLTELLWSEPARRFVQAYDYVSVPMLAIRVGISGMGAVTPPAPKPSAALHFAAFLAHLRAFHEDDAIDTWVSFLDDYVVEDDEQDWVWEYLRGKQQQAPQRMDELLAGCSMFVLSLANVFDVLSEDELGSFGLMHAYWLQKFFGYERDSSGLFVKDVDTWGRTDSWAQTLSTSPRLVPAGTETSIAALVRRQFEARVQLLERTFDAVRALTSDTRAKGGLLLQRKAVRPRVAVEQE